MNIEEIKLVHWDEPRVDDLMLSTIITFSHQRDGSIEVRFSDEKNPHDYTLLVGFNKPFVALKNIFDAINAIAAAFPGKYFYTADVKRASVYKRYTNIELRI